MVLRSIDRDGWLHTAVTVATVALVALLLSPAALAQRMHGGGGSHWGGNAGGSHQFRGGTGFSGGRAGGFGHGHNRGRFGSVVVIGGGFGLWDPVVYPYPYYAYPYAYDSSVAVPAYNMPPPVQNWYYCQASGAYYPYVTSCPGGWQEVPAAPPAPAPAQ